MLYLSGAPPTHKREAAFREHKIGLMYTPNMSNRIGVLDTVPYWAADTGCFSKSSTFHLGNYLAWLRERTPYQDRCLFATAPDVVGDSAATWARSKDVLPTLRSLGYKAALVAQDGVEDMAIEWDAFDCLFVGGSTEWKLSIAARRIAQEAKRRGKWLHVGRVNSFPRLRIMTDWGADSVDGTYLKFGPDVNLPKLKSWLREIEAQLPLMEAT